MCFTRTVLTITEITPADPNFDGWSGLFYRTYSAESGTPTDPPVKPSDDPRWCARDDDAIVGAALARDDRDATFVRLYVDPAARRRGAGRALAGAVRVACTGRLRSVVLAGQPGDRFAAALGAIVVNRLVVMRLRLADAPPPRPLAAGYEWVTWTGRAPERLLASYAAAKCFIGDAPGAAHQLDPTWTPERVRSWEHDGLMVGAVVFAGSVVAVTEIETTAAGAGQADTVVVPGHRGRGLGAAVKSRLTHRLCTERPDVATLTSSISAANVPMLATARSLGWTESGRRHLVELPPATPRA